MIKQSMNVDEFFNFLLQFRLETERKLFENQDLKKTVLFEKKVSGHLIKKIINEFWTAKQRQAHSIHEISYRACFKPQLPNFFIKNLTNIGDLVYDPFAGRGTTAIEAALNNRKVISNDINPLSKILTEPRLNPPSLKEVADRLSEISFDKTQRAEIDLKMFYHPHTEGEIVSLRNYLEERRRKYEEDKVDMWIRMVATNRLTGHSSGFFSVYTLPPNQAVSPERQKKINELRNQKPPYREVKKIILKKSKQLLKDLTTEQRLILKNVYSQAILLTKDASNTTEIPSESVNLIVTSPPFLDIVQYPADNWLRCWFNSLNVQEIAKKITIAKTINEWANFMRQVFKEFYRVVKPGGWVAFEVGEIRKGKVELDDIITPIGLEAGFSCLGVMINLQKFTKTSNIWGISNNHFGTNTNRIVLLYKN